MGRVAHLYDTLLRGSKLRNDLLQTDIVCKLDGFLDMCVHRRTLWERFFETATKKGVYLHGSVGSGKTMLMDLFHLAASPLLKCKRLHYNEFMLDVGAHVLGPQKNKVQQIAKQLASEFELLCLDEFQVIDIADAMMLRNLVSEMVLKNNTRIFMTSNRAPDSLYERGTQRESFLPCIELIKQHFMVLDLNSQDYRWNRVLTERRFFTQKSEFDSAMQSFSKEWTRSNVQVYGRQFEIERQNGSVCWLSFPALCAKAASTADMLAIAQRYEIVGLEHVCQFTEHRLEQVRRFINIVDVLYERRTRLLMHSEVPLQELFQVGTISDEAFAVKRTLSRLEHMQSLEWWTENIK